MRIYISKCSNKWRKKRENPLHHKICVRNIILSENILFHIYLNFVFVVVVFEFVFSVFICSVHFAATLDVCCAAETTWILFWKRYTRFQLSFHCYRLLLLFSRKERADKIRIKSFVLYKYCNINSIDCTHTPNVCLCACIALPPAAP